MANFISSLSGSALNDALRQVEARIPEGWAVGTYNGVAVGSNSPYYHNNAKYYAALAQSAVPSGVNGAVLWNSAMSLSNGSKSQARQNIAAYALVLTSSSFSSLPQTISNSNITDKHVVVNSVLSNPSAQTGNWTVTTSNGSLTISGSISGTTTITLYLMPNG